jgi:hypothetical protein
VRGEELGLDPGDPPPGETRPGTSTPDDGNNA